MRKMMLLATVVAIAALMLTAAPALAQEEGGRGIGQVTICHVPPGNPGSAHTITVGFPAVAHHLANHPGDHVGACEGNEDNNDNNDNNVVVPVITQDFDQEAESGDVDQSFDVSNTGDNSNQTVGIQGVANTGNAQNQIGVIDAGDFADFDNNNDFFCDDFRGDDFCEDLEDFCEDFDGNGICDFFGFDDDNDFRRFDDDFFFFGDNDDGDFEFDNVGSTIELSPTNTVSSDQQVNQAASASG